MDYGTDPDALASFESGAPLVTSHSILLPGLAPATTYFYRVTSADAAGNSATAPAAPNLPASFTTPAAPCVTDRTFRGARCGTHSGTIVVESGDGEVILAPTASAEFSRRRVCRNGGTRSPASEGGVTVVNGGVRDLGWDAAS